MADGAGGRRFEPAAAGLLDGEAPFVSRGLAAGDVDNDGDTDLVITNNNGPARLLLNQTGTEGDWIGVAPVLGAARGRRPASGVTVRVHRAGAPPFVRLAGGGGSYASWGDPRVTVPAGGPGVDRIEVQWTDGTTEEWPAPPPRAYTSLVRGSGERRGEQEDNAP